MTQLFDAAETAESKQKFLLICLQYDGMFRELPDPVWWISGQPEFAELFADGFLAHDRKNDADGNAVLCPDFIEGAVSLQSKMLIVGLPEDRGRHTGQRDDLPQQLLPQLRLQALYKKSHTLTAALALAGAGFLWRRKLKP